MDYFFFFFFCKANFYFLHCTDKSFTIEIPAIMYFRLLVTSGGYRKEIYSPYEQIFWSFRDEWLIHRCHDIYIK